MRRALEQAFIARAFDEIPVGCVIVRKGEIVGRGYNTREMFRSPLGHAEIGAIADAACRLKSKRLQDCVLYVTLEPCPMCAGAILESFIRRVVFGAYDPKLGACGSVMNVADYPGTSRRAYCTGGVLEKECSLILKRFFKKKRRDG